jgi:hypothetical protein
MDRLDYFASYAKDIKTPKDLYEAIHKFGPLPRYHIVGVNAKQEDDIHLKEPAVEDANAIYEFVRRIATHLRKDKPELPPLPPTETDPFLGLQTIQEWCIDAEKTTKPADLARKQKKDEQTASGGIIGQLKHVAEKCLEIFTKSFWEAVLDRVWPK